MIGGDQARGETSATASTANGASGSCGVAASGLAKPTATLYCATLNSPSHLLTQIAATPLPMTLVMALASLINRSTPSSSASPSIGSTCVALSVAASVTNPPPV